MEAIHPGEHLAEELKEMGVSAAEFARQIRVPTNRVTGILNGQRAISGDTALRLGAGDLLWGYGAGLAAALIWRWAALARQPTAA